MANEKRLIWDEDAKRHIIALAVGHHSETLHIDMILNAILHHTPAVDAVEVVHGRWEQVKRWATKAKYRCSVCGRTIMSAVKVNIEKYPYCHCGARMEGDSHDSFDGEWR